VYAIYYKGNFAAYKASANRAAIYVGKPSKAEARGDEKKS